MRECRPVTFCRRNSPFSAPGSAGLPWGFSRGFLGATSFSSKWTVGEGKASGDALAGLCAGDPLGSPPLSVRCARSVSWAGEALCPTQTRFCSSPSCAHPGVSAGRGADVLGNGMGRGQMYLGAASAVGRNHGFSDFLTKCFGVFMGRPGFRRASPPTSHPPLAPPFSHSPFCSLGEAQWAQLISTPRGGRGPSHGRLSPGPLLEHSGQLHLQSRCPCWAIAVRAGGCQGTSVSPQGPPSGTAEPLGVVARVAERRLVEAGGPLEAWAWPPVTSASLMAEGLCFCQLYCPMPPASRCWGGPKGMPPIAWRRG